MKYYTMKLGIMKTEIGYEKPKVSHEVEGQVVETEIEYIMRDSDKALIPCVLGNADYQAYLDDTEKVVEDYDYEAEEARQAAAEALKKDEPTEEEIQAELREMAKQNIINKKEK
jgi:predicted nucleotide-binding protein (sugar kinase/HSP70/actin superfamily)